MKYTKKITAMLLAVIMVLGTVPAAFAADIEEAGSTGTVPVQVSAVATTFSVGLPTSLPVYVSANHDITPANDVQILNNCYGMVNVKNVSVTGENNWNLVSFDTDFRTVPVDVKQFGMTIQEAEVSAADGSCDATAFESIVGYKDLDITYDAVVAVQSEAVAETIANVVFTIGWDAVGDSENVPAAKTMALTSMNLMSFCSMNQGVLTIPETITGDGTNGTEEGEAYTVDSIDASALKNSGISSLAFAGSAKSFSAVKINMTEDEEKDASLSSLMSEVECSNSIAFTVTKSNRSEVWNGGTSLNIPNTFVKDDTTYRVVSLGYAAFHNCGLTSISLPSTVTELRQSALEYNPNLTSITVDPANPVFNSANNCNAIIETATNKLVLGCQNTVIPASVKIIGKDAFEQVQNLTEVDLPAGLTSIEDSAFYATDLESIDIPATVTSIGPRAFNSCRYMAGDITIPDGMTKIDDDVFNTTAIESITIPVSVTSIGERAFSNCYSLTDVYYEGTTAQFDAVTKGDGWKYNCDFAVHCSDGDWTPAAIDLPAFSVVNYDDWDGDLIDDLDKETAIAMIEAAVADGRITEDHSKHENYVIFGKSGDDFYYLRVRLYGGDTCNVEPFERTLWEDEIEMEKDRAQIIVLAAPVVVDWSSFTATGTVKTTDGQTLSLLDAAKEKYIKVTGDTLYGGVNRGSVEELTVTGGVTSIGNNAFNDCYSLTNVTIPDGVTSIGDEAFAGCTSLTSINIPDGVTSIGVGAFYGCSSLTNVTIPDSVTSIGHGAFYDCTSLTSINIPDGVTSIEAFAFSGCSSLTNVTIPDSVTSIEEYAFRGCTHLTSVNIPNGVTSIGNYAFYGCSSLTSINYDGTTEQWAAIEKGTSWDSETGAYTIHYTDGDI